MHLSWGGCDVFPIDFEADPDGFLKCLYNDY